MQVDGNPKKTFWKVDERPSCIMAADRQQSVLVKQVLCWHSVYITVGQQESRRWIGGWLVPCFTGLCEFYKVSVNICDKLQPTFLHSWLRWGASTVVLNGLSTNNSHKASTCVSSMNLQVIKTWKQDSRNTWANSSSAVQCKKTLNTQMRPLMAKRKLDTKPF